MTFSGLVRGLFFLRGSSKIPLGATAQFNSVDFSSVFLPPFAKSISSLSPLDTLIYPIPNKA
jgi:hypothetical protein